MTIPEVPISEDLKLAKSFLKRTSLFWNIAILTFPVDFFSLFLVYPDIEYDENRYIILWIVLVAAIISANHNFVLNLILLTKRIQNFIYDHSKKIAAGLICFFIVYISTIIFFTLYKHEFTIINSIYINLGYFISILSVIFFLIKKKKELEKEENREEGKVIPIERIYYICMGRVFLPRLLSFWAAILCALNGISRSDFLCFSLLGLSILLNAKPELNNFITKCRACGKEVLYGDSEGGLCKECLPMLSYKDQKVSLPPKFNPYQYKESKIVSSLKLVCEKSLQSLENINSYKEMILKKIKLPINQNNIEYYEEEEKCPTQSQKENLLG